VCGQNFLGETVGRGDIGAAVHHRQHGGLSGQHLLSPLLPVPGRRGTLDMAQDGNLGVGANEFQQALGRRRAHGHAIGANLRQGVVGGDERIHGHHGYSGPSRFFHPRDEA